MMNDNITKIRLKNGEIEIEYEGRESLLKEGISNIIIAMSDFFKEQDPTQDTDPSMDSEKRVDDKLVDREINLSMTTIASRMKSDTGPDLAMVASVYLTIVMGKETFSQKEILVAMEEAVGYFKKNMGSNLSKNLKSLVKKKCINHTAQDTYVLSAIEQKKMEVLLAQQ